MRARFAAVASVAFALGSAAAIRLGHADPPTEPSRGPRLSLDECLQRAERSYPGLVAARHKIGASRAQLDEAWVAPFLNISSSGFFSLAPYARGNATYSPDSFGQNPLTTGTGYILRAQAETGVPISPWTWVRLGHVRDAARAGVRVSEEEHRRARLELRTNVRRAYFGLQFARDALYLLDRAEGYLRQAREQLEANLSQDGGTATANDQRQLALEGFTLDARRAEAQQKERVARVTLGLLTGVGEAVDIPDEPLCPLRAELGPASRWITRANLNRPEVAMLRAGVSARRAALEVQRYAYFPDLALGVSAAFSTAPTIADQFNPFSANNSNFAYWGAGVALRWNFEPLANIQRVRRLSEELSMTEAQQRLALGAMALEVTDVYERAVAADRRERAWAQGERVAYEWFTAVFTEYQAGASEVSTIVIPLQRYLTTRYSHLESMHDLDVALAQLAQAVGDPDVDARPDPECAAAVEATAPAPAVDESEVERILRESLGEGGDAGVAATPDASAEGRGATQSPARDAGARPAAPRR